MHIWLSDDALFEAFSSLDEIWEVVYCYPDLQADQLSNELGKAGYIDSGCLNKQSVLKKSLTRVCLLRIVNNINERNKRAQRYMNLSVLKEGAQSSLPTLEDVKNFRGQENEKD